MRAKKLVVIAFLLSLFVVLIYLRSSQKVFLIRNLITERFQYSFEDSVLKIKFLSGNEETINGIQMKNQTSSDFYIADIALSFKDDCGFQVPNENDYRYWFPDCFKRRKKRAKLIPLKKGEVTMIRGSVFCPKYTKLKTEWQCETKY